MKKLTTLFALSALALTACTESGTGQSNTVQDMPQQQGAGENPFEVSDTDPDRPSEDTPITDPPVIGAADDQPPIIDPPVIDPPIVEPPEILSDPPSGHSGELLNGNNLDSANSVWICSDTGAVSADEVVILAFFDDGSGIIGDVDTFEVVSWATSGPYIELYFNGQFLGQLDNVSVSVSADTFNASYVQPDGTSGVLDCQLAELSDVDDGTDVDGSTGDTGAGTDSTVSGMLINDISGNSLNTVWSCGLADGSSMAIFFIVDGNGGLASDQYPDGISMTWSSSSQGVSMNLDDGNQIIFSTPQFSDSDYFQVENVNILGVDVTGMDCQLVQA